MNNILDTQVATTAAVFGKTNTFLLNSILALFHRGYLGTYDKEFVETTLSTLELIKDPGTHFETSISYANDVLAGIISELCSDKDKVTPEWLEIRLKPLKVDHFEYIAVIIDEFKSISELSYDEIRARYKIYRGMCDKYKEGYLVKSVARELFGAVLNQDEMGAKEQMISAMEKISPLLSHNAGIDITSIPGISSFVKSSDEEAIKEQFREAAEIVDTRSVLRSGYSGWDKSLSDYGGMIRGSVAEMQAISGGSKSDTARTYLTGVAMNTTPFMFDKSKKPCLVYLTLEESISRSISRTLTSLRRERENKFNVDELTDDESFEQYRAITEKNGYTVFNIKGKQKELTAKNVLRVLQSIMDEGYEIHLFVMDYMGLLSFSDIDEANNSECIKTGYSYLFTFCQENRIAAILCAQIAGREYSKVQESAENDGLKELVNSNLSSQSMNIINVLDIRIMVNVVAGVDRAMHVWAVGKCRHGKSLLPSDKYCVHEMHRAVDTRDGISKPAGFIKQDIDGVSAAFKRTPQMGMDDESSMF